MTQLIEAMKEISTLHDEAGKGTTQVKGGKTYTNVSTRVEMFRKHLGLEYGIETAPLFPAAGGLMMQAWVKDLQGNIIGTGHSYAVNVSKEKGVEKLESVAIGRAMASIGLAGGEYASDGEMESWQERYDNSGIHVELSADDVDCPITWMNERLENLQAFVYKGKQPTQKLFQARISKIENDPIYGRLDANNISVFQNTVKRLQEGLNERINPIQEAAE